MAKNRGPNRTIILYVLVLTCCRPCLAKIIYVDDDASGLGNGSSWQNAYTYLQDALADANTAEKPVEVRVAQGVYRPDRSEADPEGSRDRAATFQMLGGMALVGGFAGLGASDPNVRDIANYETILSGDLAGNDVLSEDPCDFVPVPNEGTWTRPDRWCLLIESTRRENSLHVVSSSGGDQPVILDGLTIAAGNALLPPYLWRAGIETVVIFKDEDFGGGLFHQGGPLVLTGCRFALNSSVGRAGGLYVSVSEHVVMTNCLFSENFGFEATGGFWCDGTPRLTMNGCTFERNSSWHLNSVARIDDCTLEATDCKLMYNLSPFPRAALFIENGTTRISRSAFIGNEQGALDLRHTDVLLTDCEFRRNAGSYGAAIDAQGGKTEVLRCTFSGNSTLSRGGSIDSRFGKLLIRQSLFSGNGTGERGGALFAAQNETMISGCTFANNRAFLRGGAIDTSYGVSIEVVNSILWDNSSPNGPAMFVGAYPNESLPSIARFSYSLLEHGQSDVALHSNCTVIWDGGNIVGDPCFAGPGYWEPNGTPDGSDDDFWVDGDYHLKSQAGRWDPNSQSWVEDDVTSPCIDAGDPNSPVGEEPLPNGGRINMGAYGGTAEASRSDSGDRAVGR